MSSTERAPEPTMEEILASIRRIITDDDTGQARAQNIAPQARQDEEPFEGEGEADNQIIDDIARVLSGSSSGGGAVEVNEEEEILDLTAELGGLELVDDDEPLSEPASAEQQSAEPAADEPMTLSEPAPQDVAPAFIPPALPQMQMDAPPPPVPPAPEAAPMSPQAPQAAAPQPSASLEAASALERAIAALRAGQVPTSTTPQAKPFQFQAAPQPETITSEAMPTPTFMPATEQAAEPEQMAEPEPAPMEIPMAIPMEAPEPQAETHPEMEAEGEPETFELMAEQAQEPEQEPAPEQELAVDSEQEAELVLTEVEMTMVIETEDLVELEAAEPEPEPEAAFWASDTPDWQVDEAAEPEPAYEPEAQPVAAQVNGHHEPEGASMTLEDSVKDMLRPMLRQWLDENMPRMVTAALKDELDPNAFRQD